MAWHGITFNSQRRLHTSWLQLDCAQGVCIFALVIMLLFTCCLQHVPLTCCYALLLRVGHFVPMRRRSDYRALVSGRKSCTRHVWLCPS